MADTIKGIVEALDNNQEERASNALSEYAQSLSRDNFRTLVSSIDGREKDGVGLDLIIKKDEKGTPIRFAILPNELHTSAKKMAELMDQGKLAEAKKLRAATSADIIKKYENNPERGIKELILWSVAVDAYEKDGVGSDVAMDTTKPGTDGIEWQLDATENKNNDSISIPSLISGKKAEEKDTVSYPKDSPIAKLYDKVSPSVIMLQATRPGRLPGTTDTSYGSGFIVSEDGLIATNNHTFYDYKDITVKTKDGTSYKAVVVSQDPENDVGLLKITAKAGQKFQPLEIEANSGSMAMKQPVKAFTHPKGWDKIYLSAGTIVGATSISKVDSGPNPPEENPDKRVAVMAAHGEDGGSGGPVVNDNGKVCGVAELASDSARGQHIFLTLVEPVNALIQQYELKKKGQK